MDTFTAQAVQEGERVTLTIDLTQSEEVRLAAVAAQQGLAPSAWVQNMIAKSLPDSASQEQDPMLALFARWEAEDTNMTLEETAAEEQEWRAFKDSINAERDRVGARRVF